MAREVSVLVVGLLLVTAGCLSTGGGADAGDQGDGATAEPAGPDGGQGSETNQDATNESAATEVAEPQAFTFYLTADGSLVQGPAPEGEPERVPADPITPNGFQGGPFREFAQPRSPESHWAITEARLVFAYVHDGGSVQDHSGISFASYFGVQEGHRLVAFTSGPPTVTEGQVVDGEMVYELPPGGLLLPAGTPLVVAAASGYQPNSNQAPHGFFLVEGADAATRLELVAQPVSFPESQARTLIHETGEVRGGACRGLDAGEATVSFPVDVPATATGFSAELTRTSGQGLVDLDLTVTPTSGEPVPGGHTPYGDETVSLWPNSMAELDPGGWTVEVSACGEQVATFDLTVTIWEPTGPGPGPG